MASGDGKVFAIVVAGLAGLFVVKGMRAEVEEPPEHQRARSTVLLSADRPDISGLQPLEWHPFERSESDVAVQTTVSYLLKYPGRGRQGDTEAFAEVYNPEGVPLNQAGVMVVELARVSWAQLVGHANTIQGAYSWQWKRNDRDNLSVPGYITLRVPIK